MCPIPPEGLLATTKALRHRVLSRGGSIKFHERLRVKEAVLRFELRMPESESGVLTATLHSQFDRKKNQSCDTNNFAFVCTTSLERQSNGLMCSESATPVMVCVKSAGRKILR